MLSIYPLSCQSRNRSSNQSVNNSQKTRAEGYRSHTAQIMKRKNASINETQPSRNVDKQVFNAAGVLLQFLASPEEVGDAICLIRGTMPPGVVVPLHKHAEVELLYVLEGSLEFFMAKEGTQWATAGMGDVIAIPSNVKHALRNRSSLPVTLALVTKSRLYAFFPGACEAL